MATTFVLKGLPSSFGATIIQANALLLQVDDYEKSDYVSCNNRMASLGLSYFYDVPRGNDLARTIWYVRKDMSGVDATQATIAAMKVMFRPNNRSVESATANNGKLTFPAGQYIVESRFWHYLLATRGSTATYPEIDHKMIRTTVFVDPDTQDLAVPTNAYQGVHEALAFHMKPVAAGAPLMTPVYSAIGGRNPSSV